MQIMLKRTGHDRTSPLLLLVRNFYKKHENVYSDTENAKLNICSKEIQINLTTILFSSQKTLANMKFYEVLQYP